MVALAQDWPQWRGPARNGVAVVREPSAWPRELTRKWTVRVGDGLSSPVIADGRAFVLSRDDDRETVRAIDLATGAERWKDSYAASYAVQSEAARHGKVPRATPVVANGRLYTFGISSVLSSYDVQTGRLAWRKQTADQFEQRSMVYGASASPLVDRGLLIVPIGHERSGAVVAFDAATGDEKWRWSGGSPSYSSPLIADFGGVRQVIVLTYRSLVGLAPENGALLWQVPYTAPMNPHAVTPIVYQQTVMVSGSGLGLSAYRIARRDGQWTADTAWHNTDVSMSFSTPVVVGNYLYGLSDRNRGQFVCLDARTGEVVWTSTGREGDMASVLSAGAHLWLLKEDGELVIARASQQAFEPVARYRLSDGPMLSTPAITDRLLLVRHAGELSAWTLN